VPPKHHICVCICTYKRPELLSRLLSKLEEQETEGFFDFSVVIADNDSAESARCTAEFCALQSKISISYYVEPEQNIALARNKAVRNAKGDFIGLVDDDEFPCNDWLLNLYKSQKKYGADGVLGPVKPHFEIAPPRWIIKGKLCERDSFDTGTPLTNPKYTRTGNAIFKKEIFKEGEIYFDPIYGRTGGEDTDFFRRMIEKGHTFIWCDEASVYETVTPERLKRVYFLKRALMRGFVNSKNASIFSFNVLKSFIAFVVYTSALPFLLPLGHHLFMKYLIKDCDHIGKLLGVFGINIIKERTL